MEKHKAMQFLEEHILLIKEFCHLLVSLLSIFGVFQVIFNRNHEYGQENDHDHDHAYKQ